MAFLFGAFRYNPAGPFTWSSYTVFGMSASGRCAADRRQMPYLLATDAHLRRLVFAAQRMQDLEGRNLVPWARYLPQY